jgi:hypothetical protein
MRRRRRKSKATERKDRYRRTTEEIRRETKRGSYSKTQEEYTISSKDINGRRE